MIATAAGMAFMPGNPVFEFRAKRELASACADQVKRDLSSPASFSLVKSRVTGAPLDDARIAEILRTFDDAEVGSLPWLKAVPVKDAMNAGRTPMSWIVMLTFDAENTYGAALRHHAACEYEDLWGGWLAFDPGDLEYAGTAPGDPPMVDELIETYSGN